MGKTEDITFYKAKNTGKGLPFAIVNHSELVSTDDLFTPSLRDFHVIFWFKKGTGKYYIDFKEYTFHANTVILLSKDHLHYFAPFTEECEIQSIVFKPNFIYRNDSDLKHLFNFNAGCYYDGVQVVELKDFDSVFMEQVSIQLTSVYKVWEGKKQGDAFYHLLCLFLIKCEDLQKDDHIHHVLLDENTKTLMDFNQLLEENFKTESKVEYYVDALSISVKTLSRIIKDQYKISTKAVIDERRTLELKRQLRGTTKSIKEIAYDLGFDEPTNMVKYFKKHTDSTPTAFREQTK